MKLTPEQKAARARQKLLDKAKEYQLGTYSNRFVAPTFQLVIRAEAAADPRRFVTAIVNGSVSQVERDLGQCVCITCGTIGPWKGNYLGGGVIETGHFLGGRRASVLFEPTNAHPQCKICNRHMNGNHGCYEMWMRAVYGQDEIDRLRRIKNSDITFDRGQLVDMRIAFQKRFNAAIQKMNSP